MAAWSPHSGLAAAWMREALSLGPSGWSEASRTDRPQSPCQGTEASRSLCLDGKAFWERVGLTYGSPVGRQSIWGLGSITSALDRKCPS